MDFYFSGWREGNACIALSIGLETIFSSLPPSLEKHGCIIPQWIVSHFAFFPFLYLSIRSCP